MSEGVERRASEIRLERIEDKLDKLAEAVTDIARIEEKIYASTKRTDRLELRLDMLETEHDEIKTTVGHNHKTIAATERLFWLVITCAMSGAVYLVK